MMLFTWTDELTTRLILAVLDQVIRLGVSYEGTSKKPVWTKNEREFYRYQAGGETSSRKQLQSKLAGLKKKVKAYLSNEKQQWIQMGSPNRHTEGSGVCMGFHYRGTPSSQRFQDPILEHV